MRVKVLFFGMLRDVTGVPEDRLELPEGAAVGAVFEHYAARHVRIREMAGSIVMARNREFAGAAAPVAVENAPPRSETDALYRDLMELDDLRKHGLLTEEEFQAKRKKLVDKSN